MTSPTTVRPVLFSHRESEEPIDYGRLAVTGSAATEADSPDFRAPAPAGAQRRTRGRQR